MKAKKTRTTAPKQIPRISERRLRPAVVVIGVVLLVIIAVGVFFLMKPRQAVPEVQDTAAIVNGEKISISELDRVYARVPESYRPVMSRSSVLSRLIEEKVFLQHAASLGLLADDAAVEGAMNSFVSKANLTIPEAEQRLAKSNFTLDDLRGQFRLDMTTELVVNATLVPEVNVTDDELHKYYELNNLSAINISFESVKANLTKSLINDKLQQGFNILMKQLLAKANITTLLTN